jgi:phosphosulfolactate synthase (CoM biosynthesis protein A)
MWCTSPEAESVLKLPPTVQPSTNDSGLLPLGMINDRCPRPRDVGITEIRGPYYSALGPRGLADLLELSGDAVDWFKFPAPSLALVKRHTLVEMIEICHRFDVKVSAGGLVERALAQGPDCVDRYFDILQELGIDIIEVSAGMLSLPTSDYLRLVGRAKETGRLVKAEVGIQFGAGGTTSSAQLANEGVLGVRTAVDRAKRALDAGADLIILESEGVTESVDDWRTDVPDAFVAEITTERIMFEAAEPAVFQWYVKNYGPEVNLFIDHSQVLQLEALRSGIWGPSSLWGRVVTYKR